uniref:Uncharacterized protein n=1 Tax=Arundo donax TaxID=35708 RepID=A0A0A9EU67_ARUDO
MFMTRMACAWDPSHKVIGWSSKFLVSMRVLDLYISLVHWMDHWRQICTTPISFQIGAFPCNPRKG